MTPIPSYCITPSHCDTSHPLLAYIMCEKWQWMFAITKTITNNCLLIKKTSRSANRPDVCRSGRPIALRNERFEGLMHGWYQGFLSKIKVSIFSVIVLQYLEVCQMPNSSDLVITVATANDVQTNHFSPLHESSVHILLTVLIDYITTFRDTMQRWRRWDGVVSKGSRC